MSYLKKYIIKNEYKIGKSILILNDLLKSIIKDSSYFKL